MRVLLVTPNPPYPPQQGAALRNSGILHSIAKAGGQITLLSFCGDSASAPADALAALCERIVYVPTPPRSTAARLRDLLTSDQPDLARRLTSTAFTAALIEVVRDDDFDLIQFEGLEVASYAPLIRPLAPRARLVYDAHNAEYALQRNIAHIEGRSPRRLATALYSRIQAGRITDFERAICASVDGVIAVSDADAALLRALGTLTPVFTLPNGIFVEDYRQPQSALELHAESLVFTGKMDYRPNIDAMLWCAEAILPRVLTTHPDAHLYVVGQAVHRQLLPLEQNSRHISFTRWVESVTPFLHGARVFIAPLRMGSGTRLKILEAMAAGCAIVATTTAIAGLDDRVRGALVVADEAAQFADAIQRLLDDPDERARLGAAATAFVSAFYDWSVLAPQLQKIYLAIGAL
ncbi:MAG: glycosyltransferase [Chloroflexota bacterium]|nr:glycosyltransferase [Chloroflexota bacterium]